MLLAATTAPRSESWPCLLDAQQAGRAAGAVDAITAALASEPDAVAGPDLAFGRAGVALFLAERGRRGDPRFAAAALDELHAARRLVASTPLPSSLYHGVAGITWVTARLVPESAGRMNASFERLLVERLQRRRRTESFDLFRGTVGFCVYALERWPDDVARELLALAVVELASSADELPDGLAWGDSYRRGDEPERGYHLGVSHGTPGVIGVLARALRCGYEHPLVTELLEGAMRFMLARASEDPAGPAFARWYFPDAPDEAGKSVWCTGDPGTCVTLLAGARALGRADWEPRIVEIAARSTSRTPLEAGVGDACLCHGEAGLGHVYHRLYAATGDARFAQAARAWYGRALERLRPGEPMAGFAPRQPDRLPEGEADVLPAAGFIAGAAGVGLALMSACGGIEPEWDRVMLLSEPQAG